MIYEGKIKGKEEIVKGYLIKDYDDKFYIGMLHQGSLSFDGDEVEKNSIKKEFNKDELLEFALQQMVGFRIGKWGGDVVELISSMGLNEAEWKLIKDYEDSGGLDDKDSEEIGDYFRNKK